jgi:energy-coupling factor transporter ATP-binding protein EcfA2
MSITRVRISNFKSFGKDVDVGLGPLNVLVGPNGSGKSNFVAVFSFLKDLAKEGLESAISYTAGGIDYLKNLRSEPHDPLRLEVTSDLGYHGKSLRVPGAGPIETIEIEISGTNYNFTLWSSRGKGSSDISVHEMITHGAKVTVIPAGDPGGKNVVLDENIRISKMDEVTSYAPFSITISPGLKILTEQIFKPFFVANESKSDELLIQSRLNFFGQHFLDDAGIYDFDPNLPRDAVGGPGGSELESDGENLAIALKSILEDPEKKRKFLNLMSFVLPFVTEMTTALHSDGSVLLRFAEGYRPEAALPATVMSDGTINVTALLVALYFMDNPLAIIEEPDRGIHPSLASAVMIIIKEVSQQKQLIITTHSPELLKHVSLEDILLISRDKSGDSTISKPGEKEGIRKFLSDELGIADLFVSNLLGA